MRVLVVEPMKPPFIKEIGEELADLQKEVGGFIEAVYPFPDEAAVICNEEGKLMGLPLNRSLAGDDGRLTDIIAGTFLVAGLTDDGFASLTDEQLSMYAERFRTPETFCIEGGTFRSIPALSVYVEPQQGHAEAVPAPDRPAPRRHTENER
ncbi:MAG: DUF3846 domain-containing protein [Clostridia bacterium]|nr:DUF3846 domain-containing protein [Clostridia bacterium]MBR0444986.1 DUF3846 domain-containing protein [Clostridia bacterium]